MGIEVDLYYEEWISGGRVKKKKSINPGNINL